jgi:hypothetical protein
VNDACALFVRVNQRFKAIGPELLHAVRIAAAPVDDG